MKSSNRGNNLIILGQQHGTRYPHTKLSGEKNYEGECINLISGESSQKSLNEHKEDNEKEGKIILESKLDKEISKPEEKFSVKLSAGGKKNHKTTSTKLKATLEEPVKHSDSIN